MPRDPRSTHLSTMRVAALTLVLFAAFTGRSALAQEATVAVKVTISEVYTLFQCADGCGHSWSAADFYTVVTIGDERFQPGDISDDDHPYPTDWSWTSRQLPFSTASAPVTIAIYDRDPAGNEDGHFDINYFAPGLDLSLNVTFGPCTITSPSPFWTSDLKPITTGDCGTTYYSGTPRSLDVANAMIQFKVEQVEPAYAPNLRVRCLHDPIWPNAGDTVTITAEALDGTLVGIAPRQRVADSIEIWVNDRTQPLATRHGAPSMSVQYGPLTGESFAYDCKVTDDALPVISTGWRTASIGRALAARYDGIAPVYYTGDRRGTLDVVFFADQASYPTEADRAGFRDEVGDIIWRGFLAEDAFVTRQKDFSFWISEATAGMNIVSQPPPAPGEPAPPPICSPNGVFNELAWVELPLVLHRRDCRDTEQRTSFGGMAATTKVDHATKTPERIALHEGMHGLFGLDDEYGNGGCSHGWPFPNVYEFELTCRQDATDAFHDWGEQYNTYCESHALGVGRPWGACRSFTCGGSPLWTSEPLDDIMGDEDDRPQRLDLRRMEWKLCKCRYGGC